ncbi:glycosyltransferase family 4 protein [Christiangramia salexigens]|uniref:Glycosyl transferase n=1 Tax=Christiangramia salexigens TaxID=1913577 RepID=A0A1L3J4N7_9FLAO|nr:glycosyltransferase family 4 protein [Christiangramia salexigens]APG60097.1 glycosyl transferase [Christiangramia salexigens]
MHIAFLTPEYPISICNSTGGLGTSIKNMAEALISQGIEVSIILYGQELDKEFEENGIEFYIIKQRKYKVGGWYFYRKHLETRVNSFVSRYKIDLIEAPDWTGITAFMKLKCPLIIRMNGSDGYFCSLDGRKQKFKNQFFEKLALKSADRIISVSDFTGRKTMEIFGLDKEYSVIPNSISIDDFTPSARPPEASRILYFGTLIRKKGVLELAHIFNEVIKKEPLAELVLVGKDVKDIFEHRSTLEIFKSLLHTKALSNIHYLGSVDYSVIQNELSEASVVVLPSFAEALPMTWLEAMAMEKPLVTSNIGWANEVMIDGITGFTVDPMNHILYADRIISLLNDRNLAINMGKEARKRVIQAFSSSLIAGKNISYYKQTIKSLA